MVGWIFANELAVGLSNKFTQEFLGSYASVEPNLLGVKKFFWEKGKHLL